jgi:hypothetical protein
MLMPIFYRGAGIGTYWHENDARLNGFTPKKPGAVHSIERLMEHIARADVNSPYISLTRSYGVAYWYALFGRNPATETNPGYVYEIEINKPLPPGLQLLDPVKEVAVAAPEPLDLVCYQHDGLPDFILGLVNPTEMGQFLKPLRPQPPPDGGTLIPQAHHSARNSCAGAAGCGDPCCGEHTGNLCTEPLRGVEVAYRRTGGVV